MYNNVGLRTARGSGTSGHVQKHSAHVAWETLQQEQQALGKAAPPRRASVSVLNKVKATNPALVRHQKLRNVELQVREKEAEMRARGETDALRISTQIEKLRAQLMEEVDATPTEQEVAGKASRKALWEADDQKLRHNLVKHQASRSAGAVEKAAQGKESTEPADTAPPEALCPPGAEMERMDREHKVTTSAKVSVGSILVARHATTLPKPSPLERPSNPGTEDRKGSDAKTEAKKHAETLGKRRARIHPDASLGPKALNEGRERKRTKTRRTGEIPHRFDFTGRLDELDELDNFQLMLDVREAAISKRKN
ncbi:Pre-mRNA-splicing factor CWC21 [Porphyridium purpureum]|uniref:Pre-mRNA-splicing factor CWC21 n=1 Tax=Porphyridium purpureum TaxID=35688 RepID=A0A5J4Z3N9_PORPP|nr:Pre-mRNA-splicing factor CWC21 [Porphyridium purpureum]|eukprot:POR8756..scf295_1